MKVGSTCVRRWLKELREWVKKRILSMRWEARERKRRSTLRGVGAEEEETERRGGEGGGGGYEEDGEMEEYTFLVLLRPSVFFPERRWSA